MQSAVENTFDYRKYFEVCATFLAQYKWIFENSNIRFVQAGVLDYFPTSWIAAMQGCTTEELNQIPLGYISKNWGGSFVQFLEARNKICIEFEIVDCTKTNEKIKGVSPKKQYEIDNLTAIICDKCNHLDEILLDVGSGDISAKIFNG